jgi:hypothetical protein
MFPLHMDYLAPKHLLPSICTFPELFLCPFIPPSTPVLCDSFPSLLFWPWPQSFSSELSVFIFAFVTCFGIL